MEKPTRWEIWLGLVGAGIGLFDFTLFLLLDADMTLAGRDGTAIYFLGFLLPYSALGYFVGRLANARTQAHEDARVIEEQMRALQESQRKLAQSEKLAAIGRLAAGVAHEVRNPLGVIRASASMVKENFDPGEDPYRACDFICEEIDRLDGLITSLLNFARPLEPRLERVGLEKILDRALQLASADLSSNGIEVERVVAPGLPELRADSDLLSRVVLGLLRNAAEAVTRGGRIAVRGGAEHDGAVWLEVADSGSGIEPENLDQVFEPFFTTKATGTGLGLAMAVRIVEAHGGTIRAIPAAGAGPNGHGACFRLSLPPTAESSA